MTASMGGARIVLAAVLTLLATGGAPFASPAHGHQPVSPGAQIWFAPSTEAGFAALFAQPETWSETRRSITIWCVPLAWLGDPAQSSAVFLRQTFLPALTRWNMKLCVDAGRGVWWHPEERRVVGADESIVFERPLWERARQVLGGEYPIEYVRVIAPNRHGVLPQPTGAGLTIEETVRQTALYVDQLRGLVPEARVGFVDHVFSAGQSWSSYVPDVQRWSVLLRQALGHDPELVHVEVLTDADPSLPRQAWISRAREAALAQELLVSRGIATAVAFMDRPRGNGPDGAPLLDDATWYEDRLVKMLIGRYREVGGRGESFVIGSHGSSLPLLPDSGPATLSSAGRLIAETFGDDGQPALFLHDAPAVQFPGVRDFDGSRRPADSNSPSHWDGGTMYLFNSAHRPWRSGGSDLFSLGKPIRVDIDSKAGDPSRWLEATFKDDDGVLYGWYHVEPADVCPQETDRPDSALTAPQIGAMRSKDDGKNWKDLGIVMVAPPVLRCDTENHYYAGGVGDFSVLLDPRREFFYFFFSTFAGEVAEQGVAVARMAFDDLEAPVGRVSKWRNGSWGEPGLGGSATPIFPAAVDWHRRDAYAFWGPSVHWNTYLERYVMVLNRAHNGDWTQEGAYVSFNADLADPHGWTVPKKFRGPGGWYAQLVGTDAARRETDKLIGRTARYFEQGVSRLEVVFLKPEEARGLRIDVR